jgi:hypothetical protein
MALFPRVAYFLARETERAKVVARDCDLRGIVRMGSQVRYCDDKTGDVRAPRPGHVLGSLAMTITKRLASRLF